MVGSVSEQPSSQATDPIAAERAAQASSGHCQFYMARKRRFCTGIAKAGQQFCGNHLYQATGAGGVRVPCPANPKHDVPMGQLATHLAKCTDALYQAAMRAQPYFHENFNAGADEQFGPKQLQHRLAAAATAALGQTAAAEAAGPDATAAAVDPGAAVKEPDQSQQAAAAAATAAAVAAAARAMGLVPTGPDAAAVSAVAAEAAGSFLKGTAIERQAAAVALGHEGFKELLAKIDAAHAVLTAAHPLHSSKLASATDADKLKEHCQAFDKLMTFDAKHAVQNASIVGNLASAGLLQQPSSSVFLELGAGKAWLTAWLHMLHPDSNEFVLLDKLGNFNNKADRRLRHLNLTRVAVDLKDAALLPLLQLHLDTPGHVRYNGSSSSHQPVKNAAGAGAAGAGAAAGSGEAVACWNGSSGDCSADVRAGTYSGAGSSIRAPNMQGGLIALRGRMEKRRKTAAAAAVGVEAGEAATADVSAAAMGSNAVAAAAAGRQPDLPTLLPGQEQQQQQQQQQAQEQQRQQQEQGQHQRAVVPWVVLGKHLCGAATDFALRGCYNALTQQQQQQQCPAILPIPLLIGDPQQQQQQQQQQFPLQGLAIASCCHHRCGWMSYTGRDVLQAAAGITKQDFDIISWLTGWALCGHESAPGTCSEQEGAGADAQAAVADHGSTPAAAAAATLPLDDVSCPQHQHSYHSSTEQPAPTQQQPQNQQERQQQEEEERRGGWHPATTLTHQQRIQLGLKCKQLIDAGRCAWMQQKLAPLVQQPMQEQQQPPLQEQQQLGLGSSTLYVRRVTYIDESVSGENTLLVLGHS